MRAINGQGIANGLANLVVNTVVWGGSGFLGAYLIQMNPTAGIAFGAISALVATVAEPIIFSLFFQDGANENLKAIGAILDFVVPLAAGLSLCIAVGFSLTLWESVALSVAAITGKLLSSVVVHYLKKAVQQEMPEK